MRITGSLLAALAIPAIAHASPRLDVTGVWGRS